MVRDHLRGLLRWHDALVRWPTSPRLPDATPFVTLYERGRVHACFGVATGSPAERIARGFLRAAANASAERGALVASVSYARDVRRMSGEEALGALEPGTHGALVVRDGAPVFLLPQVARDAGLDARAFLDTLAQKAGLGADAWRDMEIALFEADTVSSRELLEQDGARPIEAAASWLARRVARDGAIGFVLDARTGAIAQRGALFHARASSVVEALARQPATARAANRARRWLAKEIRAALAGASVAAWPDDAAEIGGTLALATRAGIDVRRELLAFAEQAPGAITSAWHAAQIALALGAETPTRVWTAATRDAIGFAPWTLMAASTRDGAGAIVQRAEVAVAEALRKNAPHAGGADVTPVPEIALTAIAVEALAPLTSRSALARAAVARGRSFLARWQMLGEHVPAALDPALAYGAFPASPIATTLRSDVTAHALLALAASA